VNPFTNEELIKTLARAQDPHLLDAVKFLARQGFDLRVHGKEAREWCVSKANAGDSQAQYVLAELLLTGLGGDTDQEEALAWCRKAAKAGYPPALLLLSGLVDRTVQTDKADPESATRLLSESAQAGYPPALRALGLQLLKLKDKADRDRGIDYLERAAATGDFASQARLAIVTLESGDLSRRKPALESLQQAAIAGDMHANTMLGYFHLGGSYGLLKSEEKARHYFDRAENLEELILRELFPQ
jgi:TPR repeat protein